ncbi:MAG: stalk domain-containing protein [Syntrophomonadaceae bacterium]|nr:stalk domain-containing protein [Syntrophomonadaceae bacterium]
MPSRSRPWATGLILIFAIALLVPGLYWPSQAMAKTYAPTVVTNNATDVTGDEATLNARIESDGGDEVVEYGFYYGTSSSCAIKMKVGFGADGGDSYDFTLTGLKPDTKYYFKAYVKNSKYTDYGNLKYFISDEDEDDDVPEVTTDNASSIGDNYAILNGEIDSDGGSAIIEYGFYYGSNSFGMAKKRVGTHIDENDSFKYKLTGLADDTKYYFKAYAKNSEGTDYGQVRSFVTDEDDWGYKPSVATKTPSVAGNYATLRGVVTSNGDADIESYGFYYGTSSSPAIKIVAGYDDIDENDTFSYRLSGLKRGINYYVKAFATNENGTSYGSTLRFNADNAGFIGDWGNPSIFYINSNRYYLRGVLQTGDVAPYIKKNRSFLPIRTIAYALGLTDADISWNQGSQTVTLKKDYKVVKLTINNNIIYLNGTPVVMDTAPEAVHGRTCLPVAFVVKAFGGTASWDPGRQSIIINMN